MLIVSGGIYEPIWNSLQLLQNYNGADYDFSSVRILSNEFEYGDDERVIGYRMPLIHSANK